MLDERRQLLVQAVKFAAARKRIKWVIWILLKARTLDRVNQFPVFQWLIPLIITSWKVGPKEYKTIVDYNEQSIFIYPEWLCLSRDGARQSYSQLSLVRFHWKKKKNKWLHPYTFVLVCINIVFSLKLTDTLEIKMLSTLINNAHFYAYIAKFLFSFNCHHMLDLDLFSVKIQPYLHYFMLLVPIFLSYTCRFLSAFPQHKSLGISTFPFSHEKWWGLAMA